MHMYLFIDSSYILLYYSRKHEKYKKQQKETCSKKEQTIGEVLIEVSTTACPI